MTWNYRIVQTETPYGPMWGLYEVYYDDDGKPTGRTMEPTDFTSDVGPAEIVDALSLALDTALLDGPLGDWEIAGGEE